MISGKIGFWGPLGPGSILEAQWGRDVLGWYQEEEGTKARASWGFPESDWWTSDQSCEDALGITGRYFEGDGGDALWWSSSNYLQCNYVHLGEEVHPNVRAIVRAAVTKSGSGEYRI